MAVLPTGIPLKPNTNALYIRLDGVDILCPILHKDEYETYSTEISKLTPHGEKVGEDRVSKCLIKYRGSIEDLMKKIKSPKIHKMPQIRPMTALLIKYWQWNDVARALMHGLTDSCALGLILMSLKGRGYNRFVDNLPESEDLNIALVHSLIS